MINLSRRQTLVLAISLLTVVLLTILLAPGSGGMKQFGSTYSRVPQGYGAWYAFMQDRGVSIQRWQKPLDVLFRPNGEEAQRYQMPDGSPIAPTTPITLLRISSGVDSLLPDQNWVERGNVLVLIGVKPLVTDAPFTSDLPWKQGSVRIETSRRYASSQAETILGDQFGAVVWQQRVGKGRVIYAATAYLAANAYQDYSANYELLAQLVTEPGYPIWVDEYLHGYQDPLTQAKNGRVVEDDLISYLSRTPLSLLALQVGLLLLIGVWAQSNRLGTPETLPAVSIDNSEAYIQAMAGILNKANCTEFVLEMIGKAEQLEIQKALGLGKNPLPLETLVKAWQQQTGRSQEELQSVLRTAARHRRISDLELLKWVKDIQTVRRHLPS